MEGIFYIKSVGQLQSIKSQKGDDIAKLSIVITTKEARIGENGCYA